MAALAIGVVAGLSTVASGMMKAEAHSREVAARNKAAKRKANLQKAATITSGLSDLAGHLKDKGLDYTPSATPVRSGASKGAAYIGSFDEYNTEDKTKRKLIATDLAQRLRQRLGDALGR